MDFPVTGCVFAFSTLVGMTTGIARSVGALTIFVISAGIKKYKLIIKKKIMKHDKMELPAKTKLNTILISNSKPLIDSYSSHDEVYKKYREL